MNNLYGDAMSKYLPYANFKWVKDVNKIGQKLMNTKSNISTGYTLKVELEYPQELHDIHNDYPLAPEKINIPKEWLSKYCLKTANAHNITTETVKKLLPNLMNKNNYVILYRNLQHMENMRKRTKTRISQDFIRYISRPTCVNWKVFENNLAAIHEKKISLTLNKLIYVGFTILEISKWKMYSFGFMIRKFSTRLLFTDTDSLCYELYEKNPYKKMYKYKKVFDLSSFPVSSKYYRSNNKKVLGKMKDEYDGKSILKLVCLKSKIS